MNGENESNWTGLSLSRPFVFLIFDHFLSNDNKVSNFARRARHRHDHNLRIALCCAQLRVPNLHFFIMLVEIACRVMNSTWGHYIVELRMNVRVQ